LGLFGRGKDDYCCGRMENSGAVYENDDRTEFHIYDDEEDRKEIIRYCPFCGTDLEEDE
jgi:hypothetical protein